MCRYFYLMCSFAMCFFMATIVACPGSPEPTEPSPEATLPDASTPAPEVSTPPPDTTTTTPDTGTTDQAPTGPKVTTEDLGDGVTKVSVDASSRTDWVYYSFSFNRMVTPTTPENASDWDLGFRRHVIKSNSGVSGSGKVTVAYIDDQPFDSIQQAPTKEYITDKADGDDADEDPDTAFLVDQSWYVYNPQTHALTPRARVYILKDADEQYYKIQFLSYTNDAKTAGFPSFKWAKIRSPEKEPPTGPKVVTKDLGDGVTEVVVTATEASAWVYFSFATNAEVTPADPATDTTWTLAFQRFMIKTNGGINGKGGVEVAILDGKTFDEVTKAPATGYVSDQADGADEDTEPDWVFNLQQTWYEYDPSTHTLAARKRVYVFKTSAGYYKLSMTSFYKEKASGYPTFQWAKINPPE